MILGLKDLIPNYSTGLNVKKTLKVGEWIKIGEYQGKVEKVESLVVVVKNKDKLVSIPISMFLKYPVERKAK